MGNRILLVFGLVSLRLFSADVDYKALREQMVACSAAVQYPVPTEKPVHFLRKEGDGMVYYVFSKHGDYRIPLTPKEVREKKFIWRMKTLDGKSDMIVHDFWNNKDASDSDIQFDLYSKELAALQPRAIDLTKMKNEELSMKGLSNTLGEYINAQTDMVLGYVPFTKLTDIKSADGTPIQAQVDKFSQMKDGREKWGGLLMTAYETSAPKALQENTEGMKRYFEILKKCLPVDDVMFKKNLVVQAAKLHRAIQGNQRFAVMIPRFLGVGMGPELLWKTDGKGGWDIKDATLFNVEKLQPLVADYVSKKVPAAREELYEMEAKGLLNRSNTGPAQQADRHLATEPATDAE